MEKILIIGATSAIAEAVARHYAGQGATLYLLARNRQRLQAMAADLGVRGAAAVTAEYLDVNEHTSHRRVLDTAFASLGTVDTVLVAHGTLPSQAACQGDVAQTLAELNTNAISTIALLTDIANRMEGQGCGTIAVITSVAGDRGRQSNYVYGAAKAMVSVFLQGLRNRLFKAGVNVIDIKPGFVDTPMTADFTKGPLWAKPDAVAARVVKGIAGGRATLYAPGFWRLIMVVIRAIPEVIFKRLTL
jgi:short-subunit dehydrogenase